MGWLHGLVVVLLHISDDLGYPVAGVVEDNWQIREG